MKENPLDWSNMYQILIKNGIDQLIKYQETIEKYLSQEKETINSEFAKIEDLKEENEEYYHVIINSLSEEYHNYDKYYPNSFRASTIIHSYSFLEYHLKRICDHVYHVKGLYFELKDLRGGSYIEKAKKYLHNTCNVNFGQDEINTAWEFIQKIRRIRNLIVHSAGEFNVDNIGDSINNFIKNSNSLSVRENKKQFDDGVQGYYELLITNGELNLDFIETIKILFKYLLDEVSKSI